MTLIMQFLTFALILMSAALTVLRSIYLAIVFALIAIVITAARYFHRYPSNTNDHTRRQAALSNNQTQCATTPGSRPKQSTIPVIIGAASGAALTLLITTSGLLPDISRAVALPTATVTNDYRNLNCSAKSSTSSVPIMSTSPMTRSL